MIRKALIASILSLCTTAASADTMFTVANTFQDAKMTSGNEVSTVAFGTEAYANQAAIVGDKVELPNFIGFYEIDVAADMSTLTMTVSKTAKPINNPIPANRFDRYHYTFTGALPTEVEIDADTSTAALALGATAEVITAGRVKVTFSEGAGVTPGNKLVVKLK